MREWPHDSACHSFHWMLTFSLPLNIQNFNYTRVLVTFSSTAPAHLEFDSGIFEAILGTGNDICKCIVINIQDTQGIKFSEWIGTRYSEIWQAIHMSLMYTSIGP